MSGFIMFILFLLNIITILAVIVLYTRQNRLTNFEKIQVDRAREMEESMAAFVLELKEENNRLIRALDMKDSDSSGDFSLNQSIPKEKLKSYKSSINPVGQPVDSSAKQIIHSHDTDDLVKLPDLPITHEDKLELSSSIRPKELDNEPGYSITFQETLKKELQNSGQRAKPSLSEQVNELLGKGLSIEEIARKLNKGKTEIELLLRFNR